MTAAPQAGERLATWAELAAFNFEPMDMTEVILPTSQEWAEMGNSHLVTCVFARRFMEMTKPEITKVLDEMEEEVGDGLYKSFRSAIAFFEGYLKLLQNAETRVLCAGAVLMLDEEDEEQ